MPPRLSHKKSRKGCLRCKARKVKCDELRPVCTACQHHKLFCEWPDLVFACHQGPRARASVKQTTRQESSSGKISDLVSPYASGSDGTKTLNPDPEERRLLELHLMHYYLTIDATNLPLWKDPPRLRAIWTIDAVNYALRYPFLLSTIYAITSLHAALAGDDGSKPQSQAWFRWKGRQLSSIEKRDANSLTAEDYADAHRFYLNLATQSVREELPKLNGHNADAIVLASILLSIVAQNLIPQPGQAYEPPTQWISLSNSIHSVIGAARPFLSDTPIIEAIITMDPVMRDQKTVFSPSNLTPFQPILAFSPASSDPLSPADLEIYTKAFSYVGGVYNLVHESPPSQPFLIKRRLTSFPPMMPGRFSALLAERQPHALLVIACLMSMAKLVEEHWWIPHEAEKHVFGVQELLPQEWQWAMKWPLDTLSEMTALRQARSDALSVQIDTN